MAEHTGDSTARSRNDDKQRNIAVAIGLGLVLALCGGFGGLAAALGAWLAQPAFALALSWQAGTRDAQLKPALRDGLPALAVLWAAGFVVFAVLAAWPLHVLQANGSLAAALALSLLLGLALIALWRSWPLWQNVEREAGALRIHLRELALLQVHDWHGLGVAVRVAFALCGGLLLAWPGVLATWHWPFAILYALALPLLHWGVQRAPRAAGLPVVEMRSKADARGGDEDAVSPDDLDALLFEAARGGRVDRALELLDAGADPHALPAQGARDARSLVALAAVLPDLRLLRALIAHGVNLNEAPGGLTPLLAATRDSWHGRPDAVTTLLANGADPRIADSDGNTPLHHAARSSDPGVAALLRDAAAEIDAFNHDGLTPLGVACAAGNWRLAKFLLERGAKAEPVGGQPALLAAAGNEEDDVAGVQLLLKNKAKADTRDVHGRGALHAAALAGNAEIIDLLLGAGAEVNAADGNGRTPWLEAARSGRVAALEILQAHGADIHATDKDGRNALMQAVSAEVTPPNLVRKLLEWGIDPRQPDERDDRAVDLAANAGRWAIVSLLDPDFALPSAVVESVTGKSEGEVAALPDRTPLQLLREGLLAGRHEQCVALVPLVSKPELGALLHDLDLALNPGAVQWLLDHGADANAADANGNSALFALFDHGDEATASLRALLDRGGSPAGAGGLARFLSACVQAGQGGNDVENTALLLLDHGADPFGEANYPPLALAVRLSAYRLLERLLQSGLDRETRDRHGMTALHLATALGREQAVKRLVAHGASPESSAADGQTPLGVALASGRRDLADWLDWRGWPLPKRALQPSDLPGAATAGDVDAVRRLLDLGFDVDAVDAQGCTALLRAAGGGHIATVDLLLSHRADPQCAANTGATALSAAVSMRQVAIVDALLQAGAQIEHRLPGGVTVLMLASALGLPDIAARLLNAGADVHAVDSQGLTPLHCAGLFGFIAKDRARLVALFDTLLLAGADPEKIAAGSVTPMLLLLGARAEPGTSCDEDVVLAALERLLEEQVQLDVQDPRGFGPLHLAALHGMLLVVQRLLRAGADRDLRDALGRSPRDIATMRGFIDIAAQFDDRYEAPRPPQPAMSPQVPSMSSLLKKK